jgi:flagellar basal-body rod modification protein FlgD
MLTNSLHFSGNPAAADATAVRAPASENTDMFTKLLVAQIRNQDPLAPSDPSQFVNQLSQLSQTEALQNLAKLTGASASVLESMQVLAMGAQVGSSVSVRTSTVRLDGDKVSAAFTLDSASASNNLVLTGFDRVPHTVALGARAAGTQSVTIDPAAFGLPPGTYAVQLQTANGEIPGIDVEGRLDSVRMSASGGIVLKVANVGDVDPGAVTAFNGKSGSLALAAASLPPTAN